MYIIKARILLLSSLQLISLSIFFLLISITKQSNNPKGITSKDIQLINKGFPKASRINPSGTKMRSAKSIKGKNKFKNIKNLEFQLSLSSLAGNIPL